MNRYKIVETISEGSFGVVYKAISESGEAVAIKKMKHQFRNWQECVELREIKCLKKLSHPNVIKLREVIRENDELFLVFEYCDGNLFQLMRAMEKHQPFAEHHVKLIMFQLLSGLHHIHQHGFFHRDVKPENLLCNGLERVKLADFGLAREVNSQPPLTDYVSTRWYRAPEILLKFPSYSWPVDMWAAGALMAELYLFRPLFPGTGELDELYKICVVLGSPAREDWPELFAMMEERESTTASVLPLNVQASSPLRDWLPTASAAAVDLIGKLLQWDPSQRLSTAQALQHPFFSTVVKREVAPAAPQPPPQAGSSSS